MGHLSNQDISHFKNTLYNLTNLYVGNSFNRDISYFQNTLCNLKSLSLGSSFVQNISCLKNKLNKLIILFLGSTFYNKKEYELFLENGKYVNGVHTIILPIGHVFPYFNNINIILISKPVWVNNL